MIEALWSVQFIADNNDYGAGVVVFENGRLYGGDSSYYYVGSYSVKDGVISAEILVTHYSGALNNILGPIEKVTWNVSGNIARDIFSVTGHAKEFPNTVDVRLTRRAELP